MSRATPQIVTTIKAMLPWNSKKLYTEHDSKLHAFLPSALWFVGFTLLFFTAEKLKHG
jgi:hypothetical protein